MKLARIRNLIGQHLILYSALSEYEFSLEGARSAKCLLLKRFQNVLSLKIAYFYKHASIILLDIHEMSLLRLYIASNWLVFELN